MAKEDLPISLQESILALLAFDIKHGTTVAAQVRVEHFDGPYQDVATRLLNYRKEYGKPCGKEHLDDLFGYALEKGDRAPKLRRLVSGLIPLYEGLNPEYVASQTNFFVRKQAIKTALQDASERYMQGGDDVVTEVEKILGSTLRAKQQTVDVGTFLNDYTKSLKFLETPEVDYPLGIKEFDSIHVGARKGQQILYIAPKNTGKSFFCIHMGTQGLQYGATVLHVTLEMPEEEVCGRYNQRLFEGSWDPDQYEYVQFEMDRGTGRLENMRTRRRTPKIVFRHGNARKELLKKLKPWSKRLGRILIKGWPSGQMTMNDLYSYLDYLDHVHKFQPTMLIVDYPDLMKINPNNQRIELGRNFVNLRGLAQERKMALITPTQGGRQTIGAKLVRSKDVAEDISKVFTADTVLTFAATEAEKRESLGRLHLNHSRGTKMGHTVVISQAFDVGQYVKDSHFQGIQYWDLMNARTSNEDRREDDREGSNE